MTQRDKQHKEELAHKIVNNDLLYYILFEASNEQFEEFLEEE